MKFTIYISFVLMFCVSITGCKKFLDIKPKDSIEEKELFSSEVGFQQALTAVYSIMASRNLYGDNLTMGFASALAQNYESTTSTQFKFTETIRYNYTTQEVDGYVAAIWVSAYNAIAQLNNIITYAETNKNVFGANGYERIKGEAYGLRAFLHFDLMRLFAPAYAGNESKIAIPYRKEMTTVATKHVTLKEVADNILADLKVAQSLLKSIDEKETNNLSRRFFMNYLATKALEARISLYINDKPNAVLAAKEVVGTVGTKLNFVTEDNLTGPASTKDRLFSKEHIFSLRVRNIKDWIETPSGYFTRFASAANMLRRKDANIASLYESSSTDFRFLYQFDIDETQKFSSKYWQTWNGPSNTQRLDQTVPLIRLPEMYFILAECAPSISESVDYLNIVRNKRAISLLPATLSATALSAAISKEYQKEFYAEGQTFFYFKRTLATTIPFYVNSYNRLITVTESVYKLPIPIVEGEFNPNY